MLKGILFVLAIIITFDIGKALIDGWRADENNKTSKAQPIENQLDADNQIAPAETPASAEPILIDLSLPPEEGDVEEAETSLMKEQSLFDGSSSDVNHKGKKVSLSAKPIVSFDTEVKKPNLEGASVGVTIQLD